MYKPKVPYPAWDYNWDGNETPETSLEAAKQGLNINVKGKTRHVILVRHGQYDESSEKDEERILTPLGRLQAIRTGKRLREIMNGSESFAFTKFRGPCPISAIRVSNMARARETADLIAAELGLQVEEPDPDLNEAIPAPIVPIRQDLARTTEEIDQHHERIERAFQRYIYRCKPKQGNASPENEPQDEFEIIVCHGMCVLHVAGWSPLDREFSPLANFGILTSTASMARECHSILLLSSASIAS
jgi:serine/threonine-protein phosphatase PGAM5